jgi:hypothetical protein
MGPKKDGKKADDDEKKSERASWSEAATRGLVEARLDRHDRFDGKGRVAPIWKEIADLPEMKK